MPSLPTSAAPDRVKCGNFETLEERIRCRLWLSEEDLARELKLQYLPEECRAMTNAELRTSCIARYRNLRPCWSVPIGPERLTCVRDVLGIVRATDGRINPLPCLGSGDPQGPAKCEDYRRQRAYPYITFRFYDLVERAEELQEYGAPRDRVIDFTILAERAKQDFGGASSFDDRVAVIRHVQDAWRAFVRDLAPEVKQTARAAGFGKVHPYGS